MMRFRRTVVTVPFAVTIFLSAFLLFQIQPIISKYILPWFGGSSSVWTTAMLFFQALLLFGYTYAYIISRLKLRGQLVIHIFVVILTVTVLGVSRSGWSTPITPGRDLVPGQNNSPIISVLAILAISIGF